MKVSQIKKIIQTYSINDLPFYFKQTLDKESFEKLKRLCPELSEEELYILYWVIEESSKIIARTLI